MTRDQFLTEKVLGECWHEWEEYWSESKLINRLRCKKCGKDICYGCRSINMPNFSKWEVFGKLWNFCKEQEWWENFLFSAIRIDKLPVHDAVVELINPDVFADAIARFHKWEGE